MPPVKLRASLVTTTRRWLVSSGESGWVVRVIVAEEVGNILFESFYRFPGVVAFIIVEPLNQVL